jgi:hypothetical protein
VICETIDWLDARMGAPLALADARRSLGRPGEAEVDALVERVFLTREIIQYHLRYGSEYE